MASPSDRTQTLGMVRAPHPRGRELDAALADLLTRDVRG